MGRRHSPTTTPQRSKTNRDIIDLGKRRISNARLTHIDTADLLRTTVLAYEDGYADGREFGVNGKFIPSHYSDDEIVRYLTGFAAGCRVHEVRVERFGI
jgi:hypothetical protein